MGVALSVCTLVFFSLLTAAAAIDARERRLPLCLARSLAVVGAALSVLEGGPAMLARHLACAVAVCALLVLFELLWRRMRGAPGQGMGDIRALFALTLVEPAAAIAAYGASLLLLAAGCAFLRRRSLPLIPFLTPAFLGAFATLS